MCFSFVVEILSTCTLSGAKDVGEGKRIFYSIIHGFVLGTDH